MTLPRDSPESWSLEQWVAWRDAQIASILEPTFAPESDPKLRRFVGADERGLKILSRETVLQRSSDAYRVIEACTARRPDFFTADPQRAQAMGNFIRFVRAQHWMGIKDSHGNEPHQLGFEIPDRQYWRDAAPYVALPELLTRQDFLTKLASPATYRDVEALLAEHNAGLPEAKKWVWLFFKAQFITTVDRSGTYGRLLVMIPGDPVGDSGVADKWVLFGIATPEMDPAPEMRSVSVFSVYRPFAAPRETWTFFSEYLRLRDPQTGLFSVVRNAQLPSEAPSKNCYDCHKSAVLPIHPEREFAFGPQGELVEKSVGVGEIPEALNERLVRYGRTRFGPLDADAYGPSLGPARTVRSDAFLEAATAGLDLPRSSYPKIKAAMNCAGCHDAFAPINYLISVRTSKDFRTLKDKKGMVHTFVAQGLMPPGANLSPVERQALWRCLMQEYYDGAAGRGLFFDWLKGVDTDG